MQKLPQQVSMYSIMHVNFNKAVNLYITIALTK